MNFYCIQSYSSSVLLFYSLKNLCNGVLLYLILLTVSWHIQFVVQTLQAFLFHKTKGNDTVVIYCINLCISKNVNHSFVYLLFSSDPGRHSWWKVKSYLYYKIISNIFCYMKINKRVSIDYFHSLYSKYIRDIWVQYPFRNEWIL